MGYYSIYRIIKDIIRTIFGKKVFKFTLIILILFTIFFVLGEKGVFADNFITSTSLNGDIYSFPDFSNLIDLENQQAVIYISSNNVLTLCVSEYYQTNTPSLFYPYVYYYDNTYSVSVRNCTRYSLINNSWQRRDYLSGNTSIQPILDIVYATPLVTDVNLNVLFPESTEPDFIHPSFDTPKSDIENLSFDSLFVSTGSWDLTNPLYLHRLEITQTVNDDQNVIYFYSDKIFQLDTSSPYYTRYLDSDIYYFSIRKSKFNFDINASYLLVLNDDPELYTNSVGLIEKDWNNNIFDVASINTTRYFDFR